MHVVIQVLGYYYYLLNQTSFPTTGATQVDKKEISVSSDDQTEDPRTNRQTDRQTDRWMDGSEFIIIQKSIYDVSLILSYSKCMHKKTESSCSYRYRHAGQGSSTLERTD